MELGKYSILMEEETYFSSDSLETLNKHARGFDGGYRNHNPTPSCRNVIRQFLYPNYLAESGETKGCTKYSLDNDVLRTSNDSSQLFPEGWAMHNHYCEKENRSSKISMAAAASHKRIMTEQKKQISYSNQKYAEFCFAEACDRTSSIDKIVHFESLQDASFFGNEIGQKPRSIMFPSTKTTSTAERNYPEKREGKRFVIQSSKSTQLVPAILYPQNKETTKPICKYASLTCIGAPFLTNFFTN